MKLKHIARLAILALVLGGTLGGCIVVPGGGHHRHDYYRY